MRAAVVVAGVAVGGALLAACGRADAGQDRVAFSQVEVQAYLERQVARTLPGLTVGAATCPAQLPTRVGASATCTVVVDGVPLDYEVQRLVGGRFEARPARPVVIASDLAAAVQAKLGAQATSVRCGDAKVAQPVAAQPLPCQVSGPGGVRTVTVRVDAAGAFTIITGG